MDGQVIIVYLPVNWVWIMGFRNELWIMVSPDLGVVR